MKLRFEEDGVLFGHKVVAFFNGVGDLVAGESFGGEDLADFRPWTFSREASEAVARSVEELAGTTAWEEGHRERFVHACMSEHREQ
jgi:hypothetical protein